MGICVSCRRHERKAPEKRTVPGAGGPGKGAAAAELLPRRKNRLLSMANSISNIKMSNPLKGFVSKRRKRYQKHGFNLDLAYITDRLIAMGFPAEKLEGVYRNHIDEVYRFLETMHKDHYMIYNLCSERSYDSNKFHDRVRKYAFEDHMPPQIEIIQPFCEDVHEWLSADPRNVAAVHCKAGKGRTGTMVCCYLLYSGQQSTADEALKFYGSKRTHDEKGVTIPSQRRYVEYYAALLHTGLQYAPSRVNVRELVMHGAALVSSAGAPELVITQAKPPLRACAHCEPPCEPCLDAYARTKPALKTPVGGQVICREATRVAVRLTHCTPLCGDVRVDVYCKHKMKMRKEKLFHFWLNTFFVTAELGASRVPPLPDSPNLETYKLTLNKWELDDAHKDKQHKHYSQDFKVDLIVQKLPESSTFAGVSARAPSPPTSTSSSSSEPDTEPDAHWDSGERVPYARLGPRRRPHVCGEHPLVQCAASDPETNTQCPPDLTANEHPPIQCPTCERGQTPCTPDPTELTQPNLRDQANTQHPPDTDSKLSNTHGDVEYPHVHPASDRKTNIQSPRDPTEMKSPTTDRDQALHPPDTDAERRDQANPYPSDADSKLSSLSNTQYTRDKKSQCPPDLNSKASKTQYIRRDQTNTTDPNTEITVSNSKYIRRDQTNTQYPKSKLSSAKYIHQEQTDTHPASDQIVILRSDRKNDLYSSCDQNTHRQYPVDRNVDGFSRRKAQYTDRNSPRDTDASDANVCACEVEHTASDRDTSAREIQLDYNSLLDSESTRPCCDCAQETGSPFTEWRQECSRSMSVSTPEDESITEYNKETKSDPLQFYTLSTPESDPFYLPNSAESDSYLLPKGKPEFCLSTHTPDSYFKLATESKKTEISDGFIKMSMNGKKSEGITRTRLSLDDMRASWREFSGKFSDSRKKKDES